MKKFVFSKVALSRSRKFLPKKETGKKHNCHKFLYYVNTSGDATESCRLFKYFDCKFQNTYFPEHLLSCCFCRGVFRALSRWSFFVNIRNGLKPLTIFTKKLHLRCFTRFCVRLCSEVTSSIYQTYKFKVYCNSFWRHCNVFDVVFSCIKETLSPLSDVTLSKNLELLWSFTFATNTIIYIT